MQSHGRLLVISPHLDDAVFSCGALLAENRAAFACTVFTACPELNVTTEWDRDAGFAGAFEAIRARKAEDTRALGLLGACPIHLPFLDGQYQSPPSQEMLALAIKEIFSNVKPATLLLPMGLFHPDHTLVADACLAAAPWDEGVTLLAYEDIPYRTLSGTVQARLSALLERGVVMDPADIAGDRAEAWHHRLKQAAIAAYPSQLRAFGPDWRSRLDAPERYWYLSHAVGTHNVHPLPNGDPARAMPPLSR